MDIYECLQKIKNEDTQLEAIQRLRKLTKENRNNKQIVVDDCKHFVPIIIKILKGNNQLEAVQLLYALSDRSDECHRPLAGVLPHLVPLLNSKNQVLRLKTAATLWNFGVDDTNKLTIVKLGAVKPLLKIIKDSHAVEALGALKNLTVARKNKSIILKEGAEKILTSLVSNVEEESCVINQAKGALINLGLAEESDSDSEPRSSRSGESPLLELPLDYRPQGREPRTALDYRPQGRSQHVLLNQNSSEDQAMSYPSRDEGSDSDSFSSRSGKDDSGLDPKRYSSKEWKDSIIWSKLSVGKEIGSGSFGKVYLGQYHGYAVAVKITKDRVSKDHRYQVMAELDLMKQLKHPNIVLWMGSCLNDKKQLVLVTEYCARGCLRRCLKEEERALASLPLRMDIIRQIIAGLCWMHTKNVVHRDLKPANLLVTQDYNIKITDFGLSLCWQPDMICHHFKGNVKYSPPEIMAAKQQHTGIYPYNPACDVYAFGLMAWEIFTLGKLFPEAKGKKNVMKHVIDGSRPPLDKNWPKAWRSLLKSCWHQDSRKRPSMEDVAKHWDSIAVTLLDNDCPTLHTIIDKLWRGKERQQINYRHFEDIFTKASNSKVNTNLLRTITNDNFTGTVSLDRILDCVKWFGSFEVDFWDNVTYLFRQSWFHGFLDVDAATATLKEFRSTLDHNKSKESAKSHSKYDTVYLIFCDVLVPGQYKLSSLDKTDRVTHQTINRSKKEWKMDGHSYSSLSTLHDKCCKDKKWLACGKN